MTVTVVVMILLGIAFVIASFFITEKLSSKEDIYKVDMMTVGEDYQFSDRELQIIKRKIEDVIATQAKDILYETNESLSNMANEKTMALGDYAVAVCDEIEKNHKEVMFLYSMLDDKQKEIMKTVKDVDEARHEVKEMINESREEKEQLVEASKPVKKEDVSIAEPLTKVNAEEDIHEKANKIISEKTVTKETEKISEEESINVDISEEKLPDIDESAIDDLEENLDDIFAELDKTDINFDEVLESDFKDDSNANDIILEMYQNGRSVIEIAKELGLGVGEVKLVIDLYQGE